MALSNIIIRALIGIKIEIRCLEACLRQQQQEWEGREEVRHEEGEEAEEGSMRLRVGVRVQGLVCQQ